jgi:hypothetical protein
MAARDGDAEDDADGGTTAGGDAPNAKAPF